MGDVEVNEHLELFKALLESVSTGVAVLDARLSFLHANAAFEQFVGESSLSGRSFLDALPPRADFVPLLLEVRDSGQRWIGRGELLSVNSEQSVVEVRPVDIDGETHLLIVVPDVTQPSEGARADFQARALDNISDAVIGVDNERAVVYWNSTAERMYGKTYAEMCGRDLTEAFTVEYLEGESDESAERALRDTGEWRGEVVHHLWDGTALHVEVSVAMHPGNHEYPPGMLAVIRDVSMRWHQEAQREETLHELRDRWRQLDGVIEQLPVAFTLVDRTGRIVRSNDAMRTIWRGEPLESIEEYGQLKGWDADTGRPMQVDDWPLARALRTGEPVHNKAIEWERLDGTRGSILSSAAPLFDRGNAPEGAIEVIRDVTDRAEYSRTGDALNRIALLIHSSLDFDRILTLVTLEAISVVGTEAAGIALVEGDHWRVGQLIGVPEDAIQQAFTDEQFPVGVRARETRQIVVDDGTDDTFASARKAAGMSASVCIPLIVRDQVIGVLAFMTSRPTFAFTEAALLFCQRLGSTVSLALEQARLLEAVQQERARADDELQRSQALLAASAALMPSLTVERVLSKLAIIISTHIRVDRVSLLLFDRRLDRFEVSCSEGHRRLAIGVTYDKERLPPVLRAAFYDLESAVVDYEAQDMPERARRQAEGIGMRVALWVPVVRSDDLIGAFTIDNPGERREFSEGEIELLEGIGRFAAIAIGNARRYEDESDKARLAEALSDIDDVLHSSLDSDRILKDALAAGAVAIGSDTASIVLHVGEVFRVRHVFGFPEELIGFETPDTQDMHGVIALRTGEVQAIEDIRTDSRVEADYLESLDVASVVVAPLLVRGKPFANVYYNYRRPHRFTAPELDFVRRLAGSLSLALENAMLFERERQSMRLSEALNHVNELLLSTFDVNEMVSKVLSEAAETVLADKALLFEPVAGEWVVKNWHGFPDGVGQGRFGSEDLPEFNEVAEHRESLIIDDAARREDACGELLDHYDIGSYMLLPLIVQKEVTGVLLLGHKRPRAYDEQQVRYAERLATALSLALESARLFETERHIAETLQETLLVVPHHVPGIEYARLYRSATISARVGGDFIDIFQTTGRRVAFTLGDVSGKGLEAASLTAMVRNTIRAHVVESLPPSVVARKTNELLRLFTSSEIFVTAVLGTIDTRSGRLTYTSAGHPPGLILRPDGSVGELTDSSPVLGAFTGLEYTDTQCTLEPDECLILYSDGVIEARSESGELFGEDRLTEVVATLAGRTPQGIVGGIHDAVTSFTNGILRDDLALLVICRELSGPVDERTHPQLEL